MEQIGSSRRLFAPFVVALDINLRAGFALALHHSGNTMLPPCLKVLISRTLFFRLKRAVRKTSLFFFFFPSWCPQSSQLLQLNSLFLSVSRTTAAEVVQREPRGSVIVCLAVCTFVCVQHCLRCAALRGAGGGYGCPKSPVWSYASSASMP